MVVVGKFRRASDPSCSHFTVANVHINNECAKRRSVCIALLLFIRDLSMQLGAVILTGDFKKGAERELASSATTDQRLISPLEFAFIGGTVQWPTSGATALLGRGRELHGCMCCGPNVAVLSCSQHRKTNG